MTFTFKQLLRWSDLWTSIFEQTEILRGQYNKLPPHEQNADVLQAIQTIAEYAEAREATLIGDADTLENRGSK